MMWRKSRHGHGSSLPVIYPVVLLAFAVFLAMGSVKAFFKGQPDASLSSASVPGSMDAPTEYASQPTEAPKNPYAKDAR